MKTRRRKIDTYMAVLTHDQRYPCVFELALLEWERYGDDTEAADRETTGNDVVSNLE